MANRGTSFEEDDLQIKRDGGLFAHMAGVARRWRMLQRPADYSALIRFLRARIALAWHTESVRIATEMCAALGHATFLGGPCPRCLSASQTALELLYKK